MIRELAYVPERTTAYDKIEAAIKRVIRKRIFDPLLSNLETVENARDPLIAAIRLGNITYSKGCFRGRLSVSITKQLRAMGAVWDASEGAFRLPREAHTPGPVWEALDNSAFGFKKKLAQLDAKLKKVLPTEIAEAINLTDIFDSSLWKADRDISKTLEHIQVSPTLSDDERRRIAEEWQNNARIAIKGMAEEQISKLRAEIQASVMAGNRREKLAKVIQDNYDLTTHRARFIARQETRLLMTKFKEARYVAAGVTEYRWTCAAGSKAHPVRPSHRALDGKIFKWNDPPVTTPPSEPARRNNPGQDYNCRCTARPIVRFNEPSDRKIT